MICEMAYSADCESLQHQYTAIVMEETCYDVATRFFSAHRAKKSFEVCYTELNMKLSLAQMFHG